MLCYCCLFEPDLVHLKVLWMDSINNMDVIVRYVNTLRPRQDGRHFPDDIFKCNFMSENVQISIRISLKFVPKGPINNIPALVQIMAWRRSGDKPLSEPMMVSLLTHICVTRPQWVSTLCVSTKSSQISLWENTQSYGECCSRGHYWDYYPCALSLQLIWRSASVDFIWSWPR